MFYESLGHLDSISLAWFAEASIGFIRVFLSRGASSDEEGCSGFYVQVCEVKDNTMREVLLINCQQNITRVVNPPRIEILFGVACRYWQAQGANSR